MSSELLKKYPLVDDYTFNALYQRGKAAGTIRRRGLEWFSGNKETLRLWLLGWQRVSKSIREGTRTSLSLERRFFNGFAERIPAREDFVYMVEHWLLDLAMAAHNEDRRERVLPILDEFIAAVRMSRNGRKMLTEARTRLAKGKPI